MKTILFHRTEEQDNMIFITSQCLGLIYWLGFNLYNIFENRIFLYICLNVYIGVKNNLTIVSNIKKTSTTININNDF